MPYIESNSMKSIFVFEWFSSFHPSPLLVNLQIRIVKESLFFFFLPVVIFGSSQFSTLNCKKSAKAFWLSCYTSSPVLKFVLGTKSVWWCNSCFFSLRTFRWGESGDVVQVSICEMNTFINLYTFVHIKCIFSMRALAHCSENVLPWIILSLWPWVFTTDVTSLAVGLPWRKGIQVARLVEEL
jgi:hypothetical protein